MHARHRWVLGLALGLAAAGGAVAEDLPYAKVQQVFDGAATVAGEAVAFPQGGTVEALVITLAPGEATQWHRHGVPLFAYILAGTLTVTYEGIGDRVYDEGEGFLEAMAVTHQGRNAGEGPVRILAVYLLGNGGEATEPAAPPGQ